MKNTQIITAVRNAIHNIMAGTNSDLEKAKQLLPLYDQYESKIVDKAIWDTFKKKSFYDFINPIIKSSFITRKIGITPFTFYRGFEGDQTYYFLTGMTKGKQNTGIRYLVYHEPYGDYLRDNLLSVLMFEEHDFLGSRVDEIYVEDIFSLLSLLEFANETKIKNRGYNYYIDSSISFDDFKQEVTRFSTRKTKMRNGLDTRVNQYQFIINGKTY